MKDWEKTLIEPSDSMLKAIEIIDREALQIAIVVNEENRLLGIITDGDIRRAILNGVTIDEPVHRVMTKNPTVVMAWEERKDILLKMTSKEIHQIPVVDDKGTVIGLETLDKMLKPDSKDNIVVLMAGGLGSRLLPLTENCPKPLLKIGPKPILQIIVEKFKEYGFRKFFFSVNYRAEMIKEYFGDGTRLEIDAQYIHETKRLGTAGALGLIPDRVEKPIIVMNGDLLTKVNFDQLLAYHNKNQAVATMCVRDYEFLIPYGVIRIEENNLIGIDEKPTHHCLINAGVYVLNQEALDLIPKDAFYNMTQLFEKLLELGKKTAVFPIREYWMDIGQIIDFERAKTDYEELFHNE